MSTQDVIDTEHQQENQAFRQEFHNFLAESKRINRRDRREHRIRVVVTTLLVFASVVVYLVTTG
jgi:hypothetical protein